MFKSTFFKVSALRYGNLSVHCKHADTRFDSRKHECKKYQSFQSLNTKNLSLPSIESIRVGTLPKKFSKQTMDFQSPFGNGNIGFKRSYSLSTQISSISDMTQSSLEKARFTVSGLPKEWSTIKMPAISPREFTLGGICLTRSTFHSFLVYAYKVQLLQYRSHR